MLLDLKSLQLFAAVADCGSISEAARRTHLALASASKRISVLEARARTPLLLRHARGVRLTAAGQSLLVHARAALNSMEQLEHELGDFQQGIRGLVRISANASAMSQHLPAQIGQFLKTHPSLQLEIKELGSSDTIKALRVGQADVGIFESNAEHAGIETQLYHRDRLVVVIPKNHVLRRKNCLDETEIFNYTLVGLHEGTALNQLLARVARQQERALSVSVQVGSFDAMCRLIDQGLGIGILPENSILPQLAALNLRCLTLDAPWSQREHLLGYVHSSLLTNAVRAVVKNLTLSEKHGS